MKEILISIIPLPLTGNFPFSARVVTSWLSLGLFLGLILGAGFVHTGMTDAGTAFSNTLLVCPTIICLFGFVGINHYNIVHDGWYWWILPIITYIKVSFWLSFGIIVAIISFIGAILGG